MAKITSIKGRIIYNSRGSKTIEVDILSENKFLGRVCAPSGASVGKYEAVSFPNEKPEESLRILNENAQKFIGLESSDLKTVHDTLRSIDQSPNYENIGGGLAFAVTIASMESASKALDKPLFQILSNESSFKFPFPLGNILGGGAHAGPGTPDIQEILICAVGAKTIRDAIETNLSVHKELRRILEKEDPSFTNGRGDEGGWAPKLKNEKALELSAKACENLGFTLGKEVALGVDFASSTQWNEEKQKYVYQRGGFVNSSEQQIEFAANIINKYKLIYAEDAVHEEAFSDMAELTAKFPNTLVTGDDLTVTNKDILSKAIKLKSCNAAILKVNQAGSLYDAFEFAKVASQNNIKLITSHRSGESTDSHISHIGLATKSKMLKVGVVGGERVAKLNELIRLSEHDLICGMAEI
ncbi:phosphopyruvate hydratase [Candidatus Nitrosarchaeum limnium]|uniref:Enolase n=2 Tax=Candidatus Nitrosarchaeum limnium TaxID=1007084 RepID=S2E2T6_9ARCH|nr:enolase [Candidatus Nitrosarchaeum limnium]EGG41915.1 enolase [Candidatus Nitrosarchaeum limnium SFB1]EPA05585.1 enolase, C-terminal TIM barrel domain protein [Candidatus Nitrosarchaeum limnium BG20]